MEIIDAEAQALENSDVIKRLKGAVPGAVGISSTTVAFQRARSLAEDIKSFYPGIPIIIGGPHVTANPAETLSFRCFDYGVVKEGEVTISALLKALEGGVSVEDVRGIVYRKDAEVFHTPPRPYIEDLDGLPFPARHLLPKAVQYLPPLGCYRHKPVISMITSRGCPYGCIFCDKNVFGDRIRYHSPEYVISEMEEAINRYDAKEVFFVDDTFTVDKQRLSGILALMRKKGINISWSCMTRADCVTRDMLKEMKEAGCWQVSLGVESANQEVLDFIKKGISLKQIRDAVTWSAEAGLYVKGFFMLGNPTDTAETIRQSAQLARSLPFSDVVVTLTTPIPGTPLYTIAPAYGVLHRGDWSSFSYWRPVFVPHGLSEKQLYRMQRDFYLQFYRRPHTIIKQLGKIRSARQVWMYCASILKVFLGGLRQRAVKYEF